jgi:hypothetical protein
VPAHGENPPSFFSQHATRSLQKPRTHPGRHDGPVRLDAPPQTGPGPSAPTRRTSSRCALREPRDSELGDPQSSSIPYPQCASKRQLPALSSPAISAGDGCVADRSRRTCPRPPEAGIAVLGYLPSTAARYCAYRGPKRWELATDPGIGATGRREEKPDQAAAVAN